MDYYGNYYDGQDDSDELQHHGVKGMKWGVRRYQNYDGTLTQRGLQRYKTYESAYNFARGAEKLVKDAHRRGVTSRADVKLAKQSRREAKRNLSKAYDQLRRDNLADQGEKLYKSGVRKQHYVAATMVRQASINLGSRMAGQILGDIGGRQLGQISQAVIQGGGTYLNRRRAQRIHYQNVALNTYQQYQQAGAYRRG